MFLVLCQAFQNEDDAVPLGVKEGQRGTSLAEGRQGRLPAGGNVCAGS